MPWVLRSTPYGVWSARERRDGTGFSLALHANRWTLESWWDEWPIFANLCPAPRSLFCLCDVCVDDGLWRRLWSTGMWPVRGRRLSAYTTPAVMSALEVRLQESCNPPLFCQFHLAGQDSLFVSLVPLPGVIFIAEGPTTLVCSSAEML